MREIFIRIGLIAISGLFVLCVAEFVLRSFATPKPEFYLFEPGLRQTLHPDSLRLPGISGSAHFRANRFGLRGEVPKPESPNILIMGGSVVECTYLDQEESWPMLLQRSLQRAGKQAQVFAAGKSGHTSREHCAWLCALPEELNPQSVILLCGLNDFLFVLARGNTDALQLSNHILDSIGRNAFVQSSALPGNGWRSTELYALWRKWKRNLNASADANPALLDDRGEAYQRWRKYRAESSEFRQTLPDISSAIHDYKLNMKKLISFWQNRTARVYVAEVATAWNPHNTEAEESRFWMGGIGRYQLKPGCSYYSSAALSYGVSLFNAASMEVARQNGATWIPVSDSLRDPGMYYDDCHLNEAGAVHMAQNFFPFLK